MIPVQLYIILNLERICERRISLKTNDSGTAVYHFEFRKDIEEKHDSGTAVCHLRFKTEKRRKHHSVHYCRLFFFLPSQIIIADVIFSLHYLLPSVSSLLLSIFP